MKSPALLLSASLLIASPTFAKVDFEKEILPLLDKNCMTCHQAPYEEDGRLKKPKGGLRFDGKWAILAGGDSGKVLEPGDPKKSEMHFRTTLPKNDDEFMPTKGDPWTADEMKLVALWIEEGADFGKWEGNLEGKPKEVEPEKPTVSWIQEHYKKLADGVKPASADALKTAEEAGAGVRALAVNHPLLSVNFVQDRESVTLEKIQALGAISPNIAELVLSRTPITDEGLKPVSDMPNLVRLDLHQTEITDAGVKHLSGLKNLAYLNLYGTQVSDAGLKHLEKMPDLKNLFLWQSQVTPDGAKKLQKALPETEISWK